MDGHGTTDRPRRPRGLACDKLEPALGTIRLERGLSSGDSSWRAVSAWSYSGRIAGRIAGRRPVYVVFRSNGSELPGWRGESHAVALAV
jgi:hypothetical protein